MSTRWRPTARRRQSSRIASSTPARPGPSAGPSRGAPSAPGCPRCCATATRRWPPDLAAHARVADRPRLTVGITGASGLIGTALTHFLASGGHRVVRFVRGAAGDSPDAVAWDPRSGFPVAGARPRARRRDPSRRRRRRRSALDAAAHGADPRQPRAGHGDAVPRARRPAASAARAALRLGDRLLRVRRTGAGRRDGADGRRVPGRGLRTMGSGRGSGPRRRRCASRTCASGWW